MLSLVNPDYLKGAGECCFVAVFRQGDRGVFQADYCLRFAEDREQRWPAVLSVSRYIGRKTPRRGGSYDLFLRSVKLERLLLNKRLFFLRK